MADELNKPSRGTGDWDIPLNQNFDTLEAAARAFLPRGTTQTLNVSAINDDYLYASNFSGGDATTRLNSALSQADDGDTIFLENASYNSFTVSKRVRLTAGPAGGGTTLSGTVEVSADGCVIENMRINTTVKLNNPICRIRNANLFGGEIRVKTGNAVLTQITGGTVTFRGASSDSTINSSTSVSVTDNGTGNVIGTIA
jgi:hypothetical protein